MSETTTGGYSEFIESRPTDTVTGRNDIVVTTDHTVDSVPLADKSKPAAAAKTVSKSPEANLEAKLARIEGMVRFLASKLPGAQSELDSLFK